MRKRDRHSENLFNQLTVTTEDDVLASATLSLFCLLRRIEGDLLLIEITMVLQDHL